MSLLKDKSSYTVISAAILLLVCLLFIYQMVNTKGHLSDPDIVIHVKKGVEIPFAHIPEGKVWIGSPTALNVDLNSTNEYRSEYIDELYVSIYEITNKQFCAFIDIGYDNDSNWSSQGITWKKENKVTKNNCKNSTTIPDGYPVTNVNYFEAEAYCNWLSSVVDSDLDYSFRLPSESEWEYFAKGETQEGEEKRFVWKDMGNSGVTDLDIGKTNTGFNFGSDVYESYSRGGQMKDDVSWCGLYDLNGNVREIVTCPNVLQNSLGDLMITKGASISDRPLSEKIRKNSKQDKILANNLLLFNQYIHKKKFDSQYIGFRVVLEPK